MELKQCTFLFFAISLWVSVSTKLVIDRYEDCDFKTDYLISFRSSFKRNLVNLTVLNKVSVDDNTGIKFKIDLNRDGKNYKYLTTLGHKNACTFAKTVTSNMWNSLANALGINVSCPVAPGNHTAVNYVLDTSKINLGLFARGKWKVVQTIYTHNDKKNISCVAADGFID